MKLRTKVIISILFILLMIMDIVTTYMGQDLESNNLVVPLFANNTFPFIKIFLIIPVILGIFAANNVRKPLKYFFQGSCWFYFVVMLVVVVNNVIVLSI